MWKVRPAKASDINFILNSWLKRYRDAISARLVTDKVYYSTQHAVIRKILEQSGLRIFIACNPEDEDQIYGYVVGEDLTALVPGLVMLHWVYVKGPLRKYGIAKQLIKCVTGENSNVHYSHRTHLINVLDKNQKWIYNPTYVWGLL